jgi:cation/acetate symporter
MRSNVERGRVISGIIHVIRSGLMWRDAPAVGAMARLNLITTIYSGGDITQPIAYDERPQWMKNCEITDLLKFED